MPIQPSFGLSHLAKLPRAGFYLYTGLLPRHDVCMMPASHKTHNAMQEPSKAKLGPSSTVSDSAWSSYVCTQDECSDHISLLAAVHAFQPLLTLDRQAFVTNNKVKDVHSYQAMAATAGMHAAGTPVPGQPDTKPAAGITAAADVVHRVLGTNMPLNQITQVRMHVFGKCKMGISFWPSFRFKAPDREEEPGSVKLIYGSPALAAAPVSHTQAINPAATAGQQQQPGSTANSAAAVSGAPTESPASPASTLTAAAAAAGLDGAPRELLHISFTKDPPDEFNVGAKFMGGIPFPFITIRTDRLEGTMDPQTGAVTLIFNASFLAQVGKREPTSLAINATLTTEPATAYKTTIEGKRLEGGQGVLVSAAEVPKTPNWFANFILWLPTAATAKLPVRFEFS